MASFHIACTATSIVFQVTGLKNGDEVRFFVRPDPDDHVVIVDEKHTATGSTMIKTFFGLSPQTDYAANVRLNKDWIGAKTFTTPSEAPPRPDDWYWTSTVNPGSPIALSAAEWNDFCARINEFRNYVDLDDYHFITAYSGLAISAAIVNQARTAISGISGHGILPAAAVQGAAITAAFFNGLQNALNAVP